MMYEFKYKFPLRVHRCQGKAVGGFYLYSTFKITKFYTAVEFRRYYNKLWC